MNYCSKNNSIWSGQIILDLLIPLTQKTKKKEYIENVIKLTNDADIVQIFGFTVSEYAIATLRWINTEHSISHYNKICSEKNEIERARIETLVNSEIYKKL